jgi:MarR family transcriptional regulator, 2-MHQ and catechol-resistance regulon repressor
MKSATRSRRPGTAESAKEEADHVSTAAALKLRVVLARAHASVGEHSRTDISRHDLTPAEFGVLELLYHKGPQLLGEVQKKVLVSSGGITFLVDRLTKRGLVERLACPSDRRARYAALTKEGDHLMRDVFPAHAAAIRKATSGLGLADQRLLTALLKRLGTEAAGIAAAASEDGTSRISIEA